MSAQGVKRSGEGTPNSPRICGQASNLPNNCTQCVPRYEGLLLKNTRKTLLLLGQGRRTLFGMHDAETKESLMAKGESSVTPSGMDDGVETREITTCVVSINTPELWRKSAARNVFNGRRVRGPTDSVVTITSHWWSPWCSRGTTASDRQEPCGCVLEF